jgi:predicted transposase/invertase (TIGR01784 family)
MTKNKPTKRREPLYFDPTTDYGFHKLFGEEANKDLLIDFLNSMLPEHHQIADLTFKQREQHPDTAKERLIIYDIHCTAISGEYFIVEMQKAPQKYFTERSVFYGSTAVVKQGKKGKKWQYDFKTVYFVGILNFNYDTDAARWGKRKLIRKFTLKDEDGIELSDKLQVRYLQLAFFNKKPSQLKTRFDKWCFFLKNLENFSHIPKILKEDIFMKALTVAKISRSNPDNYTMNLMHRNAKRDTDNAIEWAKEMSMAEGRKQGLEQGLEQGIEQGMEKGIVLGIEKSLKKGILTIEQIADTYEVSVDYVLKIKAKMPI